ncbi:MAG TPA: DUF1841 family protein [Gammaproteobacteria bacterium]
MLFSEKREDLRRQYVEAWRKAREGTPMTALEDLIAGVVHEHPEYQALLENEDALGRDWTPEQGETNPFLHMGMHIAVREQVSTNRPPGIREAFDALVRRRGDTHAAEHDMLECLGESLWEAQRAGRAPDEAAYLGKVRQRARS